MAGNEDTWHIIKPKLNANGNGNEKSQQESTKLSHIKLKHTKQWRTQFWKAFNCKTHVH